MKTRYNSRTWLNSLNSDSTGSVVAFDGDVMLWNKELTPSTFLEISDCRNKVRLHMNEDDSKAHFIQKMNILKDEIQLFINHLERTR